MLHETPPQRTEAEVRTWDTGYRDRSLQFELPGKPAVSAPATGRFVLDRPTHPITITITWH
jgi:protein-L-isoaspartate(D-aspartate) O-methyltransferase